MNSVTLFEHTLCSYSDLAQAGWNDRHTDQLERLNERQGVSIIDLERKGIRAKQYVGIVRVGNVTLQILPKIDYSTGASPEYSATHNLLYMLSYAHDLNLRVRDVAEIRGDHSDWFEILTRFLTSELHTLFRRGIERLYVNFQETLPVVRGRWLIQQQIIRKPGVKHRFEISYDELSPDTPLNRIFKFVVDRLLRLSVDPVNLRLLHELHDWLSDVPLLPEIRHEYMQQINFTRLNEHFRPAFNMARLFLEQSAPILLSGGLPTFAFVFDMDKLFQEFVARFVRQHWRSIVPTLWDQVSVTRQSKGNSVYLLEQTLPNQEYVLRLIPDLLFGTNPTRLIADTKYKRLNPTDTRLGVSGSDLYQMLAYAVRLKCPNVLLLYPSLDGHAGLQARFEMPDQGIRFSVASLNLHHPLQDFQVLLKQLKLILNPLLQEAYGPQ